MYTYPKLIELRATSMHVSYSGGSSNATYLLWLKFVGISGSIFFGAYLEFFENFSAVEWETGSG